jgi:hypothetical protein
VRHEKRFFKERNILKLKDSFRNEFRHVWHLASYFEIDEYWRKFIFKNEQYMADILQYLEQEEIFYDSESDISEYASRNSLIEISNLDKVNSQVER